MVENKSTKDTENLSWVSGVVYKMIKRWFPGIVLTRPESINTIQALSSKLRAQQDLTKRWRERCFSAERVASHIAPKAIKDAIKAHNAEFSTVLSEEYYD